LPENPEAKHTEDPEAELPENLEAKLPETIVETDKGNHQHLLTGDSTIKLPFRQKTSKRKKIKLARKRKASTYDWESAKDSLGLDTQAHNLQVYSAAVSSGAAVETPTVNSPTKEEVKAENSLLKQDAVEYNHKICELELKNKSGGRNSKRMELRVLSLSDSLKAEKKKSRGAIEQLLALSAMQHNELVTTFQDKISNLLTEHDHTIYQMQHHTDRKTHENQMSIERLTNDNQKSIEHLTKQHNRQINDNQRSIERLTKQHFRQICKLESEYREHLTRMENHHNKSMVSSIIELFSIVGHRKTHM
jgi:hypothetical protein